MFFGFIILALMLLGYAADGIDPPIYTTPQVETVEETPAPKAITTPPPTPTATPTPTPTPTVSTEEELIQQIADEIGVIVPVYRAQDCQLTTGALACYLPDLDVIFITDKGMAKGYDYLYCILQHENRHAYQDLTGMVKYGTDGSITNREFLERDADEAESCS